MEKLNTVFSAYWHVNNNPKLYSKKHLTCVEDKKVDYFITDETFCPNNAKNINLSFENLPSKHYIKNLTKFCQQEEYVFTKYNTKIKAKTFLDLATIWTSKILLFNEILNYTESDWLTWVDCISAENYDKIKTKNFNNKCVFNKYLKTMKLQKRNSETKYLWPQKIFGGLVKNYNCQLPPVKILAQVIKMPRTLVFHFVNKYIESLIFVDNNFLIYDEEIVLCVMFSKYPTLFKLMNISYDKPQK